MLRTAKKNILVVCYAAGGARLVSAWIKKNKQTVKYHVLAAGPAKKIFTFNGLKSTLISKSQALALIKAGLIASVLTGSGWGSFELDFILRAKKAHIPTATYLDHWVNYRERFGYPAKHWQDNLPTELWVGDTYAYALARRLFTTPVRLVPNAYFAAVRQEVRQRQNRATNAPKQILFISEALKATNSTQRKNTIISELTIFKQLLKSLQQQKKYSKLAIRFHLIEKRDKYDTLIKQYSGNIKISKSTIDNIAIDLADSKLVIGMESTALALSAHCGKKTISIFPYSGQKHPLPFNNIIKVSSIKQLTKYL